MLRRFRCEHIKAGRTVAVYSDADRLPSSDALFNWYDQRDWLESGIAVGDKLPIKE